MKALLGSFGTRLRLPPGWGDDLDGPATRRQGVTLFERFTHG